MRFFNFNKSSGAIKCILGLLTLGSICHALPVGQADEALENDFSCRSASHPNPIVILHGLGANNGTGLIKLQRWLSEKGFCTFSLTYGQYPLFPQTGGLKPIADSSPDIAVFIKQVRRKTGAQKVDLVGHSEGAFQTLYTTKFGGISDFISTIVAIAPPSHGSTLSGIIEATYILGGLSRALVGLILDIVGCGACNDLATDGRAVDRLNEGPIAQSGTNVTIITSRFDEVVTPPESAFVYEPGVTNYYVQDFCPKDRAGHGPEGQDMNIWNLVLNSLERQFNRKFECDSTYDSLFNNSLDLADNGA